LREVLENALRENKILDIPVKKRYIAKRAAL
jgi:hypothetical protein